MALEGTEANGAAAWVMSSTGAISVEFGSSGD